MFKSFLNSCKAIGKSRLERESDEVFTRISEIKRDRIVSKGVKISKVKIEKTPSKSPTLDKNDRDAERKQFSNRNPETSIFVVELDPSRIQDIECQTEDLCILALTKAATYDRRHKIKEVFSLINNKTEKVCLKAIDVISEDTVKDIFELIDNPTEHICLEAINKIDKKYIEELFDLIDNQTDAICKLAINKSNWNSYRCLQNILFKIKNPTDEMLQLAIEKNDGRNKCILDVVETIKKNKIKNVYSDNSDYDVDYDLIDLGEAYDDYYDELSYVDIDG